MQSPSFLGGGLAVSGLTLAGPVWDWSATFEVDAQGNIASRTLDFLSNYWLECGSWTQTYDQTLPTLDTRHIEKVKVDTDGLFRAEVVQQNLQVHEQWWSCNSGSQIDKPTPPSPDAGSCTIGLTGSPCGPLSCSAGGSVTAHAVTAVALGPVEINCGGGHAGCTPGLITLSCQDGPHTTPNSGSNNCVGFVGIWPSAHCHTT